MAERLNYAWRVFATGLSFVCFGLGGLALRLLAFPLLTLLVREPQRRQRLARLLVHYSFRFFIGLMRVLGILTWEVRGAERLQRQGLLILANHPSLLDVVFLIALVREADCVVRGGLARNAFTRGPIRAANYLTNDSGVDLVGDCIASVRAGGNLIMFPEGTRTPRCGPVRLQRGAANIAVRGGFDITPVSIRCEPATLRKGEPWYRVPARPMHYTIEVREDLPVHAFLVGEGGEALAARRLTDHLHDYFFAETPRHAGA